MTQRLTRQDVADRLQCSVDAVDKWVAKGLLRAEKAGRLVRFNPADVEEFLKQKGK